MNANIIATSETIERYLEGAHQREAKAIDQSKAGRFFVNEIHETDNRSYLEKITIHEDPTWVTLKVFPGVKAIQDYDCLLKAAKLCQYISNRVKVGSLRMTRQGDFFFCVEAPIISSPLSTDELKAMEDVALKELRPRLTLISLVARNGWLDEEDYEIFESVNVLEPLLAEETDDEYE